MTVKYLVENSLAKHNYGIVNKYFFFTDFTLEFNTRNNTYHYRFVHKSKIISIEIPIWQPNGYC